MIGTGQCCCGDEPCCANRLFRGAGSVPTLNLTLESRQRWDAIGPASGCSTLLIPPTTTITSQELTLTHEYPIPGAFLDDLWPETQEFFDASQGWYLSPSATLFAVEGDPVFTGSKTPVTGRYFFANVLIPPGTSVCALGFWLASDHLVQDLGCSDPEWYGYISGMRPVKYGTSVAVGFTYGEAALSGFPYLSLSTDFPASVAPIGNLRAFILRGLGFPTGACYPLLAEGEFLKNKRGLSCSSSFGEGRYVAPIRLAEEATQDCGDVNPFNTNFDSVSDEPPAELIALESTHIVEEEFHILATLSEP